MDPLARIAIVVGGSALIHSFITAWWQRYKERKAREPIVLKPNRRGVHRPWGTVQKVEHYGGLIGLVYLVQFVAMIGLVVYVSLVGPL